MPSESGQLAYTSRYQRQQMNTARGSSGPEHLQPVTHYVYQTRPVSRHDTNCQRDAIACTHAWGYYWLATPSSHASSCPWHGNSLQPIPTARRAERSPIRHARPCGHDRGMAGGGTADPPSEGKPAQAPRRVRHRPHWRSGGLTPRRWGGPATVSHYHADGRTF